MSGKSILVIGARGSGKTTINRSLLSKAHVSQRLILDVNAEYKDLFDKEPIPFDKFTEIAMKVKDKVILIEEATVFLNNRGHNSDVTDILVKARHQNNTIIFSFHSIRNIPQYIFDLSNTVILLKTNDNLKFVEEKNNDALTEAFKTMQTTEWLSNDSGKKYSPHVVVSLY